MPSFWEDNRHLCVSALTRRLPRHASSAAGFHLETRWPNNPYEILLLGHRALQRKSSFRITPKTDIGRMARMTHCGRRAEHSPTSGGSDRALGEAAQEMRRNGSCASIARPI